jgi:hypothetical protein
MPAPDLVQWADAFVLVYSITDRQSFSYAKQVKQYLGERRYLPGGPGAGGGSPSTSMASLMSLPFTSHHHYSPSSFLGSMTLMGGGSSSSRSGGSPSPTPPPTPPSGNTLCAPATAPTNTTPLPIAIVGNKGDMVHLRQVSTDEGIPYTTAHAYVLANFVVKVLIRMLYLAVLSSCVTFFKHSRCINVVHTKCHTIYVEYLV